MNKFDIETREKIEKELFPVLVSHLSREFEELAISEGAIRKALYKFTGKVSLTRRDGLLILVRNYSEDADGLFGHTYEHIDVTSTFTGSKSNPNGFAKYGKFLRYGPGLIFSKNRTEEVLGILNEAKIKLVEVDADDASSFDKIPGEKFVPKEDQPRSNRVDRPSSYGREVGRRSASRPASRPVSSKRKKEVAPKRSWADETDTSSSSEEEAPKKSKTPIKKDVPKAAKKTSKASSSAKKPKKREQASSDDDSE